MPLFSQEQGSPKNPTLVFLHGFLGNVDDWSEVISYLKDDYHCVSIDLPGHGRSVSISPPIQEDFEYSHQLIATVVNNLHIKHFTFIAYSLGARIALDYTRTQKDNRLQGLIIESCHTGLSTKADKMLRYEHDLKWAKRFATQNMQVSLDQWYDQDIFNYLCEKEKQDMIDERSHNYGVYLANMLLATSLSKQTDALPFLQENSTKPIPLPIHYCFGERDHKFKKVADKLSKQTNIQLTEFNGAGHNIHHQVPLQYAQFIKQLFTN